MAEHILIVYILCVCVMQWFLPKELQQYISTLPLPQPALAMCTHVLIAKARICVQLQVSYAIYVSHSGIAANLGYFTI